jgi:methylated-DNA-[protein]-cysteine S-methyltransferase
MTTTLADVLCYRTIDTPVGTLLLISSDKGLVRVAFATEGHDRVLADHTTAAGVPRPDTDGPGIPGPGIGHLAEAVRQLAEYFAGTRREFDLDLDLDRAAGFRRRVLIGLHHVPYGRTLSYAGLAGRAGNPGAVRAAATACATNPLPIVIGCHRIVRSDGGPGGYLGGAPAKQVLLDLEAA